MYIHTLSPKRHGCSIKFLSTRSVQRRPRCILWWSHDVVPRLAEGGRRKAEHRGAMSRGVQRHPHTLTFTSMFLFTEPSSVFHQYLSLSLPFSHTLTLSPNQHHETLQSKGGGTPTPGTVINRGLYRWRCADGGWDLWFRWAHLRTTWLAPFYLCPSHKLENRRRRRSLEGFVLTVQSFSCGRPLTSRGQVYKPGTPSVKKEDRGGW